MPRLLSILLVTALLAFAPQPTQAADEPWFENVQANDATFYPKVPDNYKDVTELTWGTSDVDFEACWGSIYTADGTVLMDENTVTNWQTEFDYDCGDGSQNWLSWNGLSQKGASVPTGTYEIKVKYYSQYDYAEGSQEENVVHTLTRKVTVATGKKWFERELSYRGSTFDTKRVRGNCRAYRSSGEAVLDCWHGRYARVGYDYYIQYDLRIKGFKWWARGDAGCCRAGKVTKTGVRRRHDLDLDVQVTDWRSYRIWNVGATWWALDRI